MGEEIESGWAERKNQDGWRDRIRMGGRIESGWGEIESRWVEVKNQDRWRIKSGWRDRIRMGGDIESGWEEG